MLAVAATVATSPVPALAQDSNSEARLRKIEAEIRALQRNVFPSSDGRYFEPQISNDGTAQPATTGTSSTTAVTDILARLDAMELQMQRLTSVTEENANAVSQIQSRLALLEASPGAGAGLAGTIEPDQPSVTDSNLSAMAGEGTSETTQQSATTPAATGPSAERLAAVQEITKPQTDDAADDEYSYGFRLWNAGFFPEARQQLSSFVESYPSHWRATFGRNLLGRAFLDDGMPEEAARWFLRNYQSDRTAARASDSLLFLAESMIAMEDTRRACIALAEFGETYPAIASGRLMNRYEANRRKVTCEG
ncbi:hypothetical protein KCG46_06095 [Erythrobacter sp. WH158]|uniref:YbgF trimerisation domain-containing protein n=1 Tax=Erythrobacter crassostreae TaxID=2828328 RepID=A0A9X1F334_9SPHN|nr:hypothetical protein [Erythrobacter crassostrea]